MGRSTKVALAIVAALAIIVVTIIITVTILLAKQAEVRHEKLVEACLQVQGFYSGEYSAEDMTLIAMGCELWADNQE